MSGDLVPGMVTEQDDQALLSRMARWNTGIVWVIVGIQTFLVLLLAITVGILVRQSLTEHGRIIGDIRATNASICKWNYDVASTVPPPVISKVGLTILIDSRTVVHDLGCRPLPPPSKQLLQLAHKYGLTIPY